MKKGQKPQIHTPAQRDRLPTRREPYWARLAAGLYIGYRALRQGEGTWIARQRAETGRQAYRALGTYVGQDAFERAASAAREWAGGIEAGASHERITVAAICERYVNNLRVRKGAASADDADKRFKQLIYGQPIGRISTDKLRPAHINDWLAAQIPDGLTDPAQIKRAKNTANRRLSALKAALNLAHRERLVANDNAWRLCTAFKGVGGKRDGFLSLEQRKKFLEVIPADLVPLAKALLLTAARPGEMCAVVAKDFDKEAGTLALSGKTGYRKIVLSSAAIALFSELSKDKIGDAPLFTRFNGEEWIVWQRHDWKWRVQKAVDDNGLPRGTVLYSLRHTAISEMIMHGIDSFIVAKLAGTSTQMIDDHYGHLRHDRAREIFDAVSFL